MFNDPSGEFAEPISLATIIGYAIFGASAVVGAIALIDHFFGDNSSSDSQNATPTPSNTTNNSQMASSISSGQSSGSGGGRFEGSPVPIIHSPVNRIPLPEANVVTFSNLSFNNSGVYGVSQLGSRADPLQGIPIPEGFVPTDGVGDSGFSITSEDIVDTALDFVPIAGGIKDIYKGIRDGDGWQVAIGAGSIGLDVVTLGSASILKGAVKTGIKAGGRAIAKGAVRNSGSKLLTQGAKALHKHHVFPQQFRKWFTAQGIDNIDDFAVEISQSTHLRGIHGRGLGNLPGRWNQQWLSFIKDNPNATPSQIFYHAEGLLQRYGLEHLPYVRYVK